MNKFALIAIVIVVLAGAAMSGLFSLQPNKNQKYEPVSATASCVDFNPPSTSDTVVFNSIQYDLIKLNAQVVEEGKFNEMSLVGQAPSGQSIYTEPGSNYFGERTDSNLIFVLQNLPGSIKSPYIFNIYLKDGVPIPPYITNCKTTGGQMTILAITGDTTVFPPSAFNKTDIVNLLDPNVSPAYVYNGNKNTLDFIKNLGAKLVGNLPVQSKNSNLPLYFHLGTMYLADGVTVYEYLASDKPIDLSLQGKKSLQLKPVTFVNTASYSWWTPSCKPAIYLYPQKTQNINVKVNTTGFFTLTIPNYPANGWNVLANPNGSIQVNSAIYPYLYYESQVPDSKIQLPDKGYVVTKAKLPGLFDSLFPKLGLLPNEANELKNYWQKALPLSPYYFVAIMSKEAIEAIEPLDINPRPETVIRVRLYFQLLEKWVQKDAPVITTPKRSGFTVVEWGGMVKTDKEHPFTCSQ